MGTQLEGDSAVGLHDTEVDVGGVSRIDDLEQFVDKNVRRLGATLVSLRKSRDYHMEFVEGRNEDIAAIENLLRGFGVNPTGTEFFSDADPDPVDDDD